MHRTRVDDALDPGPSGGVEHVEGADDVGVQDAVEAVLEPDAAEVHHRANPFHHPVHGLGVRQVRLHDLLVLARRAEGPQIGAAQAARPPGEVGPQPTGQATGSAGEQQALGHG
jgi:hypothetical protein